MSDSPSRAVESGPTPDWVEILNRVAEYCEQGEFEHGCVPRGERAEDDLRRLASQLPGLLADRERIEWLGTQAREDHFPQIGMFSDAEGDKYTLDLFRGDGNEIENFGDTLRDAIDAARARLTPEGE